MTSPTEILLDDERPPEGQTEQDLALHPLPSVVVGQLFAFDAGGYPLITVNSDSSQTRRARSTLTLAPADIGRDVVLAYESGDPGKPVILGLLQPPGPSAPEQEPPGRLVLTARESIEIRCGAASISIRDTGKVVIRGNYVVSRSSGVNRIVGASVEVN
jgi:hypothetical protein